MIGEAVERVLLHLRVFGDLVTVASSTVCTLEDGGIIGVRSFFY